MRKLKLNPDELAVESFTPRDAEPSRGTVVAHETEHAGCESSCVTWPRYPTCDGIQWTCWRINTCFSYDGADTCLATCGPSCAAG